MKSTKKCINCDSEFVRNKKYNDKQWNACLFCSHKCFGENRRITGWTHSKETRLKLSETHRGTPKPWAGKYKRTWRHKSAVRRGVINMYLMRGDEIKRKISLANTGRIVSQETRTKLSERQKRDKNYGWLGDKAKYSAKHKWLSRNIGKPASCIDCGKTDGKIQWSNVDHKYRHSPEDYVGRCPKCHAQYDKKFGRRFGKKPKNQSTEQSVA